MEAPIKVDNIRKQWFFSRVGKRIYRPANACKCKKCKRTAEKGIRVKDHVFALQLYRLEVESLEKGHKLKYFDTKAEVEEYINQRPDAEEGYRKQN